MNRFIDTQYDAAKRNVCIAVSDITALAFQARPQKTLHAMTVDNAVVSFYEWVDFFGKLKGHPVSLPDTRMRMPKAYKWPLAPMICSAELYLKVADLVEAAAQVPNNKIAEENLYNLRNARSVVSQFLRDFRREIAAEAKTPEHAENNAVIEAAAHLENLPEKFQFLAIEIQQRSHPDNKLRLALIERHSGFHDTLFDLGARPLGLYPSLGGSAAIVQMR